MARFLSFLFWTAVFLLIMLVIDQFLLRAPASAPAHATVATFYRDLRSRLLDLAAGKKLQPAKAPGAPAKPAPPGSIEAVIEQRQPHKTAHAPTPGKENTDKSPAAEPEARYLYADEQGTLHFAATLAEIPEQYRGKARPLGE